METPEAEEEELVPEPERLLPAGGGQVDGYVPPEGVQAHRFRQEPPLQNPVLEVAPAGHELGAEDREGVRVVLALGGHLAPEDGEAPDVPIVQNLHYLGLLVRHPEVALVHDEGPPEGVENAEEGRDRGGPAREDGLVAEGEPTVRRKRVFPLP